MILIVDTNVVISALLKEGKSRELLIDSPFVLCAPENVIEEIRKHEDYIIDKSKLSREEFERLFHLLVENIRIIPRGEFIQKMPEAHALIGHVDRGDVPFLALAMSIPCDGIWTENVKHFNVQNKVKIYTTKELAELSNEPADK